MILDIMVAGRAYEGNFCGSSSYVDMV
ncbi:unnamed protein product [Cuscuta epithymum]|uniref:Uncharacterized protein n=1 Tax=Cuscuta epithymum TaxID=186058 RepID=A0AAV0D796_9ASTE|nr:unnamed protein product [Cuscuta epithymum]